MLALLPNIAAWAKNQIDNALGAAGTSAAAIGVDKLEGANVLYHGLSLLGGGAILGGVVLGATTACMIDRQFTKAAAFALAGAILTFFGFMHGEAIGIGQTPTVAAAYLGVGALLMGCAKFATVPPPPKRVEIHESHAVAATD